MNEKLKVEEAIESLSKLDPTIMVELHKMKIHLNNLKNTLHDGYAKYSILQALVASNKNGGVLVAGDTPTEEEISDLQKSLSKKKKEMEITKSSIHDTIKELEKDYDDYKTSLKVLEQLTEEYQQKKQLLQVTDLNDDSMNTLESIQKRRTTIRKLNMETEKQLRATELNILAMRALEGKKQEKSMTNDRNYFANEKIIEWCHKILGFIKALPGIKDRGITGDMWSVSITGMEFEGSSLELNVTMVLDWSYDRLQLKSVQVDNTDIDLSDVINRAIELNDIRYLLAELQRVWLCHFAFVNELETLRKRYALDWDQSTRTLKVIYGARADLICVLNVKQDYPGNSAVTLISVKGGHQTNMEYLEIAKQDATLTEWLNHLHERLTNK